MKKLFFTLFIVALVLTAMTGCRKSGLQNICGVVKDLKIHKDTLLSMTLIINEDGDTMLFNMDDARIQRGMMMPRDSVIVDYMYGQGDTIKALVVTLISKVKLDLEEDQGTKLPDSLVTIPISDVPLPIKVK